MIINKKLQHDKYAFTQLRHFTKKKWTTEQSVLKIHVLREIAWNQLNTKVRSWLEFIYVIKTLYIINKKTWNQSEVTTVITEHSHIVMNW